MMLEPILNKSLHRLMLMVQTFIKGLESVFSKWSIKPKNATSSLVSLSKKEPINDERVVEDAKQDEEVV